MATTAEIATVVSNVGFPIVAFILMYRFAREAIRSNTEALQQVKQELARLREQHDP